MMSEKTSQPVFALSVESSKTSVRPSAAVSLLLVLLCFTKRKGIVSLDYSITVQLLQVTSKFSLWTQAHSVTNQLIVLSYLSCRTAGNRIYRDTAH